MTRIGSVTEYTIDSTDRIRWVNDEWHAFAKENSAASLTQPDIVGRTLWSFIGGPEVRQIYRALIERVRSSQRPAALPFRCDSPDCVRHMTLRIASDLDDSVHFAVRLDRQESRDPIALLDPFASRSTDSVTLCSMCKAVLDVGEKWLELAVAVERLGLLAGPTPPRLSHGICPDCSSGFDVKAKQAHP